LVDDLFVFSDSMPDQILSGARASFEIEAQEILNKYRPYSE